MVPTLLTGVPGWLGTGLLRTLVDTGQPWNAAQPRRRLRCLVHPSSTWRHLEGSCSEVEFVSGDLRDDDGLKQFLDGAEGGTLFHCAGLIHPRFYTRHLFDVNVRGTRCLLHAAEEAGVRRVVAVSSNSPLGMSRRPSQLFDESSPYRPYLSYGRSKMLMEQLVAEFGRRGRLETVIIRAPWFYGPYQPPRQTLFFHMIRDGMVPVVGDGQNRRSMAYIDNLCQGLLLAEMTHQANGKIYWIADRRPYTWNEIIDTVERLLQQEFHVTVRHRRLRLPTVAGDLAVVADTVVQSLGLYVQKLHVLAELDKTIACSIARAEEDLGYRPTVELEEGMRRSLAWCRDNGVSL